jgi:concanavalin A-like lectin/glucanase superfamily protein
MGRKFIALTCLICALLLADTASAELVGWWTFDGNYDDVSGNGHNGTAEGTPAFAGGQYGQAVQFDGDDWVNCGTGLTSTTLGDGGTVTGCSIAFWVNRSAAGDHKICGDVDDAGWAGGGGIKAAIYNNLLEVDMRDSDQRYFSREDTTPPTGTAMGTDTWYHIAVVFDDAADTMLFYLDGVVDRSLTVTQGMAASTIEWRIGTDTPSVGHYANGLVDDLRLYDHAITESEVRNIMAGKGPGSQNAADPSPAAEAVDVPRDTILAWTAGEFAATHDVYLGTSFDDVNMASRANPMDMLVSEGQAGTTYQSPAVLEFGQTYYWRVDEVNAAPDNTIFKGETWSFTVEPLAYPVAGVVATSNGVSEPGTGPENTVNGSGLNENDEHSTAAGDMWLAVAGAEPLQIQYEFPSVLKLHEMLVWNYNVQFELMLGFGLKDVTVEYSEDGENWAVLGDVQLAQGTATAGYAANSTVDFGGVAVKYVRLTVNSGYGMLGQFGLSEVRFLSIPVLAREPEPADGTMDVSVDAALAWRSGREAVSHEVYLGTDAEALALVDTVMTPGSTPDDLQLAATYYWQVTEVNEAASPSAWAGSVWSFTTEEFVVVDDFESYDDEDNVIYEAWIDGWFNETGSTVGYLSAPFAEQEMVHGGGQSMPLFYDNAGGVSETDLTLAGQDWTRAGITTLTLFFRGEADNTGGQLYVKINGVKVAHGGADALSKLLWQQWNIDLASVGTNLANVTSLTIGIEGSGAGKVYIDDIRLYLEAAAVATPTDPGSDGVLLQYTFDGDASDSSGNGYDGTLLGDARVQDGVLALDGIRDAVSVPRIGGADATFSAFTVSMWVHPMADLTTLEFSGGMNSDVWAAGAVHFKFHYGALNVGISGLDGGDLEGASMGVINAWNHIALTVSDTEIAIYLNGGLEDSAALDAPAEAILGDAALGAWNNADTLSREMTGEMDNVLIYDRALSAGEILFLSNQ